MRRERLQLAWQLMLRLSIGIYWLYFASQRWLDISWVERLLKTAAEGNYVPLYGDILRATVAWSWENIARIITIAETAVGLMVILGILVNVAGAIGALIGLNLLATFAFCSCPWNESEFPLVFWFYFAPILLNMQLIFDRSSEIISVTRLFRRGLATRASPV
ncbi:MAG: hypothetical protein NXY59_06685 [Aigarchaeota archaeon]|nr:hypothetical protein [Candidatus Pelearchaeum maunauluense]